MLQCPRPPFARLGIFEHKTVKAEKYFLIRSKGGKITVVDYSIDISTLDGENEVAVFVAVYKLETDYVPIIHLGFRQMMVFAIIDNRDQSLQVRRSGLLAAQDIPTIAVEQVVGLLARQIHKIPAEATRQSGSIVAKDDRRLCLKAMIGRIMPDTVAPPLFGIFADYLCITIYFMGALQIFACCADHCYNDYTKKE